MSFHENCALNVQDAEGFERDVATTMPKYDPAACVDVCARDVTLFIQRQLGGGSP